MNKNTTNKPIYWSEAVRHLNHYDPVISKLIKKYKSGKYLSRSNSVFKTMFKIIIGQQISIEAASSIEKKIIRLLGRITSKNILNTSDDDLRKCGLSFRKAKYLKGIAKLLQTRPNYFQRLKGMSDSNAIDELKLLYGIGQWSAEMFLIFYFNRKNILPLGDIGLINSFCNNYKVKRNMFLSNIKKYKKLWDPYCTVATWYLWRDIDEDVVQY